MIHKNNDFILRSIKESDLQELWEVSYRDNLEWLEFDGPYFNDPVYTNEEFLLNEGLKYYANADNKAVIVIDERIVGLLTYQFIDGTLKQWLEFGIVIYDKKFWNKGLGTKISKVWIDYLFVLYPYIQRVGFTTWSGNLGMMKVADNLNMTLEARVRKVRYYKNEYWDSIKFGILRDEFY